MTTTRSVSGVLGLCRAEWPTLHSAKPRISRAAGYLCKVCKVRAHARAHTKIFQTPPTAMAAFFSHARPKKPYQPYTLYTGCSKALILIGSICVGFVLGWLIVCWVAIGACWR